MQDFCLKTTDQATHSGLETLGLDFPKEGRSSELAVGGRVLKPGCR